MTPDPAHQSSLAVSSGAAAAIEVQSLTVDRGSRRVLDGVSCSIPAGSVVGLLGPSGSGKSTFMRAVVGVQQVRSGRVTVLSEPAGTATLRRRIGSLTQAPSIYADLTVRENARYFASLYGIEDGDADATIVEVGLGEAADQLVHTLSGGQRARASLACTLVSHPDVLILDEPTVGQDPVLRNELWQRFRESAERGGTLLVSSHVMDEARRCDRLLFISDGAIIADGTPVDVMAEAGTDDMDEAFLRLVVAKRESNGR
jgi:ABC-2 type transport system ATP-binding protein